MRPCNSNLTDYYQHSVVQASTDLAILKQFAGMLRQGKIGSKGAKYSKIVGIGHSYGSAQLNGLAADDPTVRLSSGPKPVVRLASHIIPRPSTPSF
jgi:hypothetical protein